MASSFCKVNIQFVFAVKFRECLIREDFREELQKFITVIVQRRKHRLWAIYCMPDHVHIFVGKHPTQSEAELARDIKSNSSKYINEQNWVDGKFAWQGGYGVFSYSPWDVEKIVNYVLNQRAHHAVESFRQEFTGLLDRNGMEYEEEHLFEFFHELDSQ
jgi:REP element-mobilizing transposase RayT